MVRVLLALVAVVSLCGGCATGMRGMDYTNRGTMPTDVPFPYRKGVLAADFWEQAAKLEKPGDLNRNVYFAWPLPFASEKLDWSISADRQSAVLRKYSMITIGVPELYIPLFFGTSARYYKAGSLEPVGLTRRQYNLLWADSWTRGDTPGDVTLKAGGVPILWDSGTESGPTWHFDDYRKELSGRSEFTFTSIFSFVGPAWGTWSKEEPSPLGTDVTVTKAFFPAYLGKGGGMIAWSDYVSNTTRADGATIRTIGHGPVGGYPVYYDWERAFADGDKRALNMVLAGILWFEAKAENPARESATTWAGPLWGGFGKSTRRTGAGIEHRANIFWLPIKYKTE